MLCQLKIPFESLKNLKYGFLASSVMHGMLMENIPTQYAAQMHSQSLRPFSQFSSCTGGQNFWTVSVLSQQAYENIIIPLLSLSSVKIRHKNDVITFKKPEISSLSYESLLQENILTGKTNSIKLDIVTPTAFKSSGLYVILPTLRLIFLNLAKRFDFFYGIQNNNYDILANQAEQNISVSDYTLKSCSFALEGIKIPAFTGSITFRISGDSQFQSYISMLCSFAEFSGMGIKTAIGMGQVKSQLL